MNLTKLFETQKALRDRINYQREDRFEKLILALLVELGECANEWRGFKFWSKDQESRTFKRINCPDCLEKGFTPYNRPRQKDYFCDTCAGYLIIDTNPLLEEYADGLAFILEIGLETYSYFDVKLPIAFSEIDTKPLKHESVTKQFNNLFCSVTYLDDCVGDRKFSVAMETEAQYQFLVREYIGLGEMLGFTWEQIEQAYYAKMQINHQRQATGY